LAWQLPSMSDVTHILSQIEAGDPSAAEQLLPLVYDELRKLAAAKLAHEQPGQTLQATALVHEAYLRLVDVERAPRWDSRGHFFAAAAEAMRRILVDGARRRDSLKRGGALDRVDLPDLAAPEIEGRFDLLALDDALRQLEVEHPEKAKLVKLRFFAGCSLEETAEHLAISRATAQRHWAYARAWLFGKLKRG
jgi:RNA polymerase sigma factor (TIGR02999 family)